MTFLYRYLGWAIPFVTLACNEDDTLSQQTGLTVPQEIGLVPENYLISCELVSSALQCVRLNTTTGDMKQVDLSRLPVLESDTAMEAAGKGRYEISCAPKGQSMLCVRLDQESGKIVLIPVEKLPNLN